jgi:hypothetical protein
MRKSYKKLTRDQFYELQIAYDEAMDDISGMGGKHALMMAALNKLGYYPNSWQKAIALAEKLLWEVGYDD